MREPCPYCTRKHVAKASVLYNEFINGYANPPRELRPGEEYYPHEDLIIGNLSEAEDESIAARPAIAELIRTERRTFEEDNTYCIRFLGILNAIHTWMVEETQSLREEMEVADRMEQQHGQA